MKDPVILFKNQYLMHLNIIIGSKNPQILPLKN